MWRVAEAAEVAEEDREETQHKGTEAQRSDGKEMGGKSLSLSLSLSKDRE